MISLKKEIAETLNILKSCISNKKAYNEDLIIIDLLSDRYELCYNQIHNNLALKKSSANEKEILLIIKDLIKYDLKVCDSKIDRFLRASEIYEKRKDTENLLKCKKIIDKLCILQENLWALISFRSLEHFAQFMEWDKREQDKIWKHSIDTFGDNGYSGCSKGFFYYANKMVLTNDIKFIMKQMPTSFGKCIHPLTQVRTPKGIISIKDLQVGDFVYSMENNSLVESRVLEKWNSRNHKLK
jgi:hypothetical protein